MSSFYDVFTALNKYSFQELQEFKKKFDDFISVEKLIEEEKNRTDDVLQKIKIEFQSLATFLRKH